MFNRSRRRQTRSIVSSGLGKFENPEASMVTYATPIAETNVVLILMLISTSLKSVEFMDLLMNLKMWLEHQKYKQDNAHVEILDILGG
jgi:hypothetical protein